MMSQYKTQSAAELNAIFKKRRARADQQEAPLGLPPDFKPQTPSSYDGPDSDCESTGYIIIIIIIIKIILIIITL